MEWSPAFLVRSAQSTNGRAPPPAASPGSERTAGVHVPVRRAEADERRDEVHAAGVRHRLRELLRLARVANQAEAIAEPLDRRTSNENRTLERVGRLTSDAPRDRRQEPVLRHDGGLSGVEQHEAAGA